jgi:hypothetical protein
MNKPRIKENSFDGAPGGLLGTVTDRPDLSTFTSPNAIQEPNKFNTISDKNKTPIDTHSNTTKGVPEQPIDKQRAIDQVYSKPKVPTSDQVQAGIDYELHNMIKPDKNKAEEIVMTNLMQNPDHYGKLNQLNIDDDEMVKSIGSKEADMPLTEVLKKVNMEETKKIFDSMVVKKDTKFVVNQGISDIMKGLWEARNSRPKWKKGDPTL